MVTAAAATTRPAAVDRMMRRFFDVRGFADKVEARVIGCGSGSGVVDDSEIGCGVAFESGSASTSSNSVSSKLGRSSTGVAAGDGVSVVSGVVSCGVSLFTGVVPLLHYLLLVYHNSFD